MLKGSEIRSLIMRALGPEEAAQFDAAETTAMDLMGSTAKLIMESIPPMPLACLLLSSTWALYLREKYGVPAIAVAGDVKMGGSWVFRAGESLPPIQAAGITRATWRGHCWVEVPGCLADISIFRTAYSLPPENEFRRYIQTRFGLGRGMFMCPPQDLPPDMNYRRRFVLNMRQMHGLADGQAYLARHGASALDAPLKG